MIDMVGMTSASAQACNQRNLQSEGSRSVLAGHGDYSVLGLLPPQAPVAQPQSTSF